MKENKTTDKVNDIFAKDLNGEMVSPEYHQDVNMRTLEFDIPAQDWKQLEDMLAAIPVVGDRYNAEQQRQVGR